MEMVRRMALDSHIRELYKAGLNISDLHMPADSIEQRRYCITNLQTVSGMHEWFYR